MSRQATTSNDAINARIRAACGFVPGAEEQPERVTGEQAFAVDAMQALEEQRKLPTANAGNGARATGVGVPKESVNKRMNDWMRLMSMGKGY